MNVWIVERGNMFNGAVHSNVHLTEEAANYEFEQIPNGTYKNKYMTTDIWDYIPRHFSDFISVCVERHRVSETEVYEVHEIQAEIEATIKSYKMIGNTRLTLCYDGNGNEYYCLSVAWVSNNQLYHEAFELENSLI